jgi:hypothetical protein
MGDPDDVQPWQFHLSTAVVAMLALGLLMFLNFRNGTGWPLDIHLKEAFVYRGGSWVYEHCNMIDMDSVNADLMVAMFTMFYVCRACEFFVEKRDRSRGSNKWS